MRKYKTRNKPVDGRPRKKRTLSNAEKKLFNLQKNPSQQRGSSTYNKTGLDTSRADAVKDIKPDKGQVYQEEKYRRSPKLKTYDKFMKDSRDKKGQEKLDLVRKATKEHQKLSDEDRK